MKSISGSIDRHTFQRNKYIERQTDLGKMDDIDTNNMIEWYNTYQQERLAKEQDPEWQKNNLEFDLRTTDWILCKVRGSDSYAQNLYAALCNNDFCKNEPFPILREENWNCSWRYAGGIIADMREQGDYIDWYCSGIGTEDDDFSYVGEQEVTDEIREDLIKLGWIVREDNES